jgi:hypothetical protein
MLRTERAATFKVALYILRGWFENRSRPVLASNVYMVGVSRHQKSRAIAELEALGLVKVKRRPGTAPLVTPRKVT